MLTEGVVRDAEPREKTYKLFDTGGLFVMVNSDGSRWWRLKYRYGEKERGISLGVYPLVSLKLARQKRDDAKRMLADGLDPSHQRRVQRVSQTVTFEVVAQEWLELQSKKLGAVTIYKARWILEKFVYPQLGSRPISQIKAPDLLDVWSRRIVGWSMRTDLKTEGVIDALNMALAQRRPQAVVHHSDHGCQYTSYSFGKRCQEMGVMPSMGSVGDAYDNAMAESFFATLERELLNRRRFKTQSEARMAVFEWIEGWYNPHRRHSSLGRISPINFERRHLTAQAA